MRELLTQTSARELPRLGRYEILFDLDDDGFVARAAARVRGPSAGPTLVELAKVGHALALEAEVRAAFLAEARAAGRVRHVNFVQPVDTMSVDGELYVATELTLGARLDELWRAARAEKFEIPLAVNLRILLDVLAGISALHAAALGGSSHRPLVHGDVCPANISISYRGDARLIHSGLSAATSRVAASGRRNLRLPYKAPEQLRAGFRTEPIGPGADVFAGGVMLWEALKGEGPFEAPTDVEVVERICFGALPALDPSETRFTHLALSPLVRAALDRNPERRIPDAAELGDAIERTHGVRAASVEEVARVIDALMGPALDRRREQIEEAVARAEEKTTSEQSPLGLDSHLRRAHSVRTPAGYMPARQTPESPTPSVSARVSSGSPSSEAVGAPGSVVSRSSFSRARGSAPPPVPFSQAPGSVQSAAVARSLEYGDDDAVPARSRRPGGARVVGWAYAIGLGVVVLALVWIWRLDGLSLPMRTGEVIDTDVSALPGPPKRHSAVANPSDGLQAEKPPALAGAESSAPPLLEMEHLPGAMPAAHPPVPSNTNTRSAPGAGSRPVVPVPAALAPMTTPAAGLAVQAIAPPKTAAPKTTRPRPAAPPASSSPSKALVRPESDIPEEI
jgi:serine/threonine protein kinase